MCNLTLKLRTISELQARKRRTCGFMEALLQSTMREAISVRHQEEAYSNNSLGHCSVISPLEDFKVGVTRTIHGCVYAA